MGRELGGRAEVPVRGASVWGGWSGLGAIKLGSGGGGEGGNTLSFHAAPPPPQPCPSLSLFFSPSLTLGVCLPAVSMATRWLWCCCWWETGACMRRRERDEMVVWSARRGSWHIWGNWQSEAFGALNITAQTSCDVPLKTPAGSFMVLIYYVSSRCFKGPTWPRDACLIMSFSMIIP